MGAVVSHLKHILNMWSVNMYSFFLINLANCIRYHSDLRYYQKTRTRSENIPHFLFAMFLLLHMYNNIILVWPTSLTPAVGGLIVCE